MTQAFEGGDSHISIGMPEGTRYRAYVPFLVYSSDDGGEIVAIDFKDFTQLAILVAKNRQQRQVLTDLPHSPDRTAMRPIQE